MKVFLFHLMPYAYLDLDYDKKYRSAWVVLPNSYFDPKKGHELYNRYLDELEYGEELGFDGLCVNEHHQNAYGIMPSPIVTASALARRTTRVKLAIVGSAFGIREHPLTLAEEHAMIDCISGGRLISGMVRGIGCEYYSMGANPAFSHDRFHEAHDLVIRAWTEEGPFAFEGEHYHFEYVNLWPRPYQQPHPPIWCPSQGSTETIEWTAHPDRKYTYLQTYSPFRAVTRFMDAYRAKAREYGYEASPDQLGWLVPIYVAETDEQARDEAQAPYRGLRQQVSAQPAGNAAAAGLHLDRLAQERAQAQVEPEQDPDRGVADRGRGGGDRQPRHGAREAARLPAPRGARQRAGALPVRNFAGRPHPEEHGDVRRRGDARAAGLAYRAAGARRGRIAQRPSGAGPR